MAIERPDTGNQQLLIAEFNKFQERQAGELTKNCRAVGMGGEGIWSELTIIEGGLETITLEWEAKPKASGPVFIEGVRVDCNFLSATEALYFRNSMGHEVPAGTPKLLGATTTKIASEFFKDAQVMAYGIFSDRALYQQLGMPSLPLSNWRRWWAKYR